MTSMLKEHRESMRDVVSGATKVRDRANAAGNLSRLFVEQCKRQNELFTHTMEQHTEAYKRQADVLSSLVNAVSGLSVLVSNASKDDLRTSFTSAFANAWKSWVRPTNIAVFHRTVKSSASLPRVLVEELFGVSKTDEQRAESVFFTLTPDALLAFVVDICGCSLTHTVELDNGEVLIVCTSLTVAD
jgi:hypothetical protein